MFTAWAPRESVCSSFERAVYPLMRRRLTAALSAERPDLWISVHPLQIDMPLWIMSENGSRVPFVTVVTDPVTPPVAWFSPDVDLCVVATEPAACRGPGLWYPR